jgi:acyl carrier protein
LSGSVFASYSRDVPSSDSIAEAVLDVVRQVSRRPVEPTVDSDLIADLAFDSLEIMETIAQLEDRFGITIPLEEAAGTRTVRQIAERVADAIVAGSDTA